MVQPSQKGRRWDQARCCVSAALEIDECGNVRTLLIHVFRILACSLENSHCMETARYLRDKLTDAGFTCRVNHLSSTVVLERPLDDKIIKRWQLACEEDIAHVVVMPNVTRHKIDRFVRELVDCKNTMGRIAPVRENSPLTQLYSSAWGCSDAEAAVSNH